MAIHGRFYTVVVPLQDEAALILGAPILGTDLVNTGDIVTVYDPDARNLGSSSALLHTLANLVFKDLQGHKSRSIAESCPWCRHRCMLFCDACLTHEMW